MRTMYRVAQKKVEHFIFIRYVVLSQYIRRATVTRQQ